MTSDAKKLSKRKPYQRKQSHWWWLRHSVFRRYMLREATSIFVLLFSLELIYGLLQLSRGFDSWNIWLANLSHPLLIVFNCMVLLAVLYHAATWFKLAPKIIVVRLRGWTLSQKTMINGQWLGMIVFTAGLITLAVVRAA